MIEKKGESGRAENARKEENFESNRDLKKLWRKGRRHCL
jgi:hypothetical protein